MKNKGRNILKINKMDILNILICTVLLIVFVYPFWDTLMLSVSDSTAAGKMGLRIIPKFPLTFAAYERVFEQKLFINAVKNSFLRTIIGTSCTVFMTFTGGYVLSKRTLPFCRGITLYILFTMFFGGGLIPTYLLIQKLNLLDTFWVYILPCLTSAWNLLITRNFLWGIPESVEDAARIDGAGVYATMFRIIMPMSKPVIAVISLWSAIGHWNSWYDAYIYNRTNDHMVLQLLLRRILVDNSRDVIGRAIVESTAATTPETVKAATIVVAVIPIACAYPLFQKHFIKGVNIGAVKG